jgi:hypothetical protein
MEVHHHPHLPHGKKKFKDYFLEFLMLFLAVTLGFLAENFREHISERKQEKEYIHSFVSDLKQDTAYIRLVTRQLFKNIRGQDSLVDLLQHYQDNDSINKKCYRYYLSSTLTVPQMTFNDKTISQLINTGNMHLITKKGIADSIMNYNSLVKAVTIQGQYYNEQFKKTFDYSVNLFDFGYARTPVQENFEIKRLVDPKTAVYKLITTDEVTRKKYISNVVMLQNIIGSYVYDLKATKDYEGRLIELLEREY